MKLLLAAGLVINIKVTSPNKKFHCQGNHDYLNSGIQNTRILYMSYLANDLRYSSTDLALA